LTPAARCLMIAIMATVTDRVLISQPVAIVFSYASDIRTFTEWGTGVLSVAQIAGDGPGVNAAYAVRRKLGRRVFDVNTTLPSTSRTTGLSCTASPTGCLGRAR
jgi:hypothetical protein